MVRRRRYLGLVVAGITTGVAGCSNSNGSGTADDTGEETSEPGGDDSTTTAGAGESNTEDDDDDSTGTATPSSRDLGDPAGSVGEAAPPGLSIIGLDSHPGSQEETDGEWVTDVTAENTGDQETSLINYNYELILTGEDGETLYDGLATIFGEGQAAPGESGTVTIAVRSNADEEVAFEDVASYQVSLICASQIESAYCE